METAVEDKKQEEVSRQQSKEIVVEIEHLRKCFGDLEVLKDINLQLHRGESVVVLGRSGTGKSVTIQCIVGLLTPDGGSVKVFGQEVSELNTKELRELRIRVGFLFQSGALYDSMTVRENMEFPLTRILRLDDQAEINRRVEESLDSVGLLDAIDKLPGDLSGGMRKRAGLARTLIVNPEIILYDEPTTGLDPITSREISELIVSLQKKHKTSSIIITHDMDVARVASDRVLIMHDGEYAAGGTFDELLKSKNKYAVSYFNES